MITIITKPVSRIYDTLKFFQILLLKIQKKKIPNQKYGGHYAVTRSVVEGLGKIKADFNYNPKKLSDISDAVYVPGGYQALKWAIKMKRKGKIKKLIAGPNQVITPYDNDGIIKSKYIDLFLTNSEWVRDFYIEMAPELSDHIDIWPAGVDTEFWKPEKKSGIEKNVLIYYKRPIKKMFDECVKILKENGFAVEILYYGKYTTSEYKEALNRNNLLIHFVEQESKGISLAEAWSMDTPTIVWNPG
jgi:glycosyltransferase involved in cell wall biosynthesis